VLKKEYVETEPAQTTLRQQADLGIQMKKRVDIFLTGIRPEHTLRSDPL
jgi:hypothetical protein